jgi:hypothetical protein
MITGASNYFCKTEVPHSTTFQNKSKTADELRSVDRALKSHELHKVILDTRTKIEEASKDKL